MVSSSALLEALEGYYDEMWESGVEWGSLMWEEELIPLNVEGVQGVLSCVTSEGGGEGGTEEVEVVLMFTPSDLEDVQFFKKYGSYASHCGYYWDGSFRKTTPKLKTITVYEDVEG